MNARRSTSSGKRVGIWVRVSKLAHRSLAGAQTESAEHHRIRAELYAKERGFEVVEVYDLADVTGKDVWRHPEAQRMLGDVRSGRISGLIFSKLARLGRKTDALIRFQEIFSEYGADLIAIDEAIDTTTADGRNYFRHKASDAEWEREQNQERMRESVEIRAKLGRQISGSSPFGYRWVDGKLQVDPSEAPIRILIYELFLEHRRKRTVARLLTEAGYRTRRGGAFTPLTVERLIRDPTAKGCHRRNYTTRSPDNKATLLKPESEWEWVPVEAVVSEDLWKACNDLLVLNRQPHRKPAKKAVQLFAGLLYCGPCSEKMYVPSNTPKYVCRTCRSKIPKVDLEKVFVEQLRSFYVSADELARHTQDADGQHEQRSALLEQLVREQQKVTREMERTYQLYLDDDAIQPATFKRLFRPLEERAEQLENEIPRLQAEVDFIRIQNLSTDALAQNGLSLFDAWQNLDLAERRVIIENITQRIEVNGDEIAIELCYLPPPLEHVVNWAHTPRTSCSCCGEFIRIANGADRSRITRLDGRRPPRAGRRGGRA